MESNFPAYNGKKTMTPLIVMLGGNCTQYVYNRITQLGKRVDLTMGNGQDWGRNRSCTRVQSKSYTKSEAQRFPSHWRFRRRQYLWSCRICGKKVFKDGSILISEMNVKGLNVVSTRTISADETHLMNYIVPKR